MKIKTQPEKNMHDLCLCISITTLSTSTLLLNVKLGKWDISHRYNRYKNLCQCHIITKVL